ncbi:DUF3160 domain-containing protein [Candidatus Formimonas warabiya]|uniref:Uncharacterized protein n=1 Tax=Formimonas warabiya TaxID=1761012 RepID=A0A3G1KWM6_FORW1|nr:DUF3160 domain-containing protein [Candidatus Formimonas warabiya]ATW26841.1 hypothetical protein DCMF_20600 [Candidatus Formimonas warabiya]
MKSTRTAAVCLSVAMVVILLASLTGCQSSAQDDMQQQAELALISLSNGAAAFAPYSEVPVTLSPAVETYRVAADLSNLTNKDRFDFSPEAQKLLGKNGFVVAPSSHREFFSVYEINRYETIPNFVTTDAMLHNYHL